eukprot:gnl/Chilomastix_caulleri/4244.p1 GENE.gnl/Chilomastix_caulleri/4244~~gnl/Chilomastix_caulleri/4244.p1  ORF type:complete len:82 (+),score=20.08 gnl/Chilomastix_caulleri/4244:98-343(+)
MLAFILCSIVGALAATARENPYSLTMCTYIDSKMTTAGTCGRDLQTTKSKFCDGDKFYFKDEEIDTFIQGSVTDTEEVKTT